MKTEQFEHKIRELLPEATQTALSAFVDHARSLEEDEIEQAATFYDRLYVDLSLVLRDHGVGTATKLFNHGEFFTFNPYELREAANLLERGLSLEQIEEEALGDGCDPTEQEFAESSSALAAFQDQLLREEKTAPPPRK